jgi:hypothetical protein
MTNGLYFWAVAWWRFAPARLRKSQSINGNEEPYMIPALPDRPTMLLENGNN